MVDRNVRVRLSLDMSNFKAGLGKAKFEAAAFAKSLDTSNDRMSMLLQSGLALGPALVPTLAAGSAAAAALGSSLGAAAVAGGVAALALNGVGDAVEALNAYQLEPTAENLAKIHEAMAELGPAGREFALFIGDLGPKLERLQATAQEGFLPGLQDGISALMSDFPIFERLVGDVAEAMGELSREGGEALSGPFWTDFFRFISTEAGPALERFGRTIGNFAEGAAGMFQAFNPLAVDFSQVLLDSSRSFAEWGRTLGSTQGFQEFTAWVRETGPQVADTFGALATALVEVVKATAPVGQIVLPVIEGLANALAILAGSPVGPVLIGAAAGLSAISRAVALYNAANGSALAGLLGKGVKDGSKFGLGMRTAAAGAGVFALAMTDVDDKLGLSNTASLALLGTMAGPWGAAVGAGAGLALDLAAANDELAAAADRAQAALEDQPSAFRETAAAIADLRDEVNSIDEGLGAQLTGEPLKIAAEAGLLAMERRAERARQAVSDLNEELGRGPVDTSNLAELERVATELGPAFEAAGLDVDEYTAAVAAGGFASATARAHFAAVKDEILAFAAAQDSIPGRSKAVASAIGSLDDKMLTTAQSADTLAAALDSLFTPQLDLSAATDAWNQGLRSLNKELGKAATKGLQFANVQKDLSPAAFKVRAALRGQFQALVDVLNAEAKAGANAQELTLKLRNGRDKILDFAQAAGLGRKETAQFLRTLGLTPKLVRIVMRANFTEKEREAQRVRDLLKKLPPEVITKLTTPGAIKSRADVMALIEQLDLTERERRALVSLIDNASGGLQALLALIARVDGQVAVTRTLHYVDTIQRFYSQNPGGRSEDGNIFVGGKAKRFAYGGVEPHEAQIDPGNFRIWAEPETGGEAYIPLASSKRQRSLRIWAETGHMLGVPGFQDGGISRDTRRDVLGDVRDQFGRRSPLVDVIERWLDGLKRGEFSRRELNRRLDKALRHQVNPALRQFNVGPRQGVRETRGELRELHQSLRETFGADSRVVNRLERQGRRLVHVATLQDRAARRYERANDKLDRIVDNQRGFARDVRQAFRHDAFGDEVTTRRGALLQLRADANDAQRATRQFRRLGRRGLDDPIIRQLAASGNTALLRDLSRSSRGEIRAFERAFHRRNRELRELGRFTSRRVFGDEVRAQTRVAHRTERTLRHLNRRLGRIEHDIERGAERGVRRGFRQRQHAQRRRRRAKAVR